MPLAFLAGPMGKLMIGGLIISLLIGAFLAYSHSQRKLGAKLQRIRDLEESLNARLEKSRFERSIGPDRSRYLGLVRRDKGGAS